MNLRFLFSFLFFFFFIFKIDADFVVEIHEFDSDNSTLSLNSVF